ncbi:hypothetical protein H5410_061573, partial [Solanum commersonii]
VTSKTSQFQWLASVICGGGQSWGLVGRDISWEDRKKYGKMNQEDDQERVNNAGFSNEFITNEEFVELVVTEEIHLPPTAGDANEKGWNEKMAKTKIIDLLAKHMMGAGTESINTIGVQSRALLEEETNHASFDEKIR